MTGKIFISYRREDSSWSTGRIYDRLLKHFSEEQLFIDVDSIAPGDDFVNYIEESVNNCDVLLAVIGQRWLETIQSKSQDIDFVRLEIAAALKNNVRVIPILVENTKMPLDKDLPGELKSLTRKNAFFINLVSFNSEIETLVQTIQKFFLQKEEKLEEEKKQKVEGEKQKRMKEENEKLAEEELKLKQDEEEKRRRKLANEEKQQLLQEQMRLQQAENIEQENSGTYYNEEEVESNDNYGSSFEKARFPNWAKIGIPVFIAAVLLYMIFRNGDSNDNTNAIYNNSDSTSIDSANNVTFLSDTSTTEMKKDPNVKQPDVQPSDNNDYDKEFKTVEKEAKFPGDWNKFLELNLNSQVPADNGAPAGKYTVIVSFIVNKSGEISDVVALKDPGYGTADEVVHVIKKGPNWIPATQNGRNVIYRQKQSITFEVTDDRNDSIKK